MPNNYYSGFKNSPINGKSPASKGPVPAKQGGKAPKQTPFEEPLKITNHVADKGSAPVKKGTGLNKYHGKIV